jgi:hypothetical protein
MTRFHTRMTRFHTRMRWTGRNWMGPFGPPQILSGIGTTWFTCIAERAQLSSWVHLTSLWRAKDPNSPFKSML